MVVKDPAVAENEIVMNDMTTKSSYTRPPINFNDIRVAYLRQKDAIHPYVTKLLKNYYMWKWDRRTDLQKLKETWKTNIKSPLTMMFVSSAYNQLLDSDIRFSVTDIKGDKQSESGAMLDLGNYVMTKDESEEALWSSIFDGLFLGFGTLKVSYVYREETIRYQDRSGKKKTDKIIHDYPVLKYVSPYNIVDF